MMLAWLCPGKGALPRRHLVDDRAEREEIGARVHGASFELLRRHVLQRAHQTSLRR